MVALYNEWDAKAAAWLGELIAQGHLPAGRVNTRSITDVGADDLAGAGPRHFFAGIGGWPLALRLAGVPDWWPVWTASLPCQPFSTAGKRAGYDDDRHLAPVFLALVGECKPAIVLGEQVASAAGRAWFSDLRAALEALGYACWCADLCAAGIGAPHIRQRLFWGAVRLADAERDGPAAGLPEAPRGHGGVSEVVGDCRGGWAGPGAGRTDACGLGDAGCERDERRRDAELVGRAAGEEQGKARERQRGRDAAGYSGPHDHRPSAAHGGWSDADWLLCRDAKWRPVEPGTFPLADGVSARVGRLRGYGNAIVPALAAEFIEASREILAQHGLINIPISSATASARVVSGDVRFAASRLSASLDSGGNCPGAAASGAFYPRRRRA